MIDAGAEMLPLDLVGVAIPKTREQMEWLAAEG